VEVAEIVRRWVWVFIRVEWEIVKRTGHREVTSGNGMNADSADTYSYELMASGIDDETHKLGDRHS